MCFLQTEDTTDLEYCTRSLRNLKGISIASLNVCHLLPKIDDIKIILEKSDIDVLCINETFLDDAILDAELTINRYNFHRADRTAESVKSCGCGLLIYYKNSRDIYPIPDATLCTPNIECCWIELNLKLAKRTLIHTIYRAPDGNLNDISIFQSRNPLSREHVLPHMGNNPQNCMTSEIARQQHQSFS